MFAALCLYFYFATLVVGVPARLILRRRVLASARAYAIIGGIIGGLPAAVGLTGVIISGQASAYMLSYNILLFTLGGAVGGLVFWWIRVRQRSSPDLQSIFG